MSRKQVVLLAILALAILAVAWLARSNRQPPFLPQDGDHASFSGAEPCLKCHGPDGPYPQSRSHPTGFDCIRCHGTR